MRARAFIRLALLIALFAARPTSAQQATPTSQPTSILDKLVPDEHAVLAKTPDGLRISVLNKKDQGILRTPAEFKSPLVITATARTDSNNLRLYYGDKGLLIFNWELNGNELRHHDPKTGQQSGVAGKGAIAPNTWVTVRWTIDAKQSRVEVDGVERACFSGDYSGLAGSIGIGTYEGAVITVKSLQITSATPDTKPTLAGAAAPVPSTKDITDLMDAQQFPAALNALARVLQLKGASATSYDRRQLLLLKVDCLLQIHDNKTAMATLTTTAQEAKKPDEAYDAMAMGELIQKSTRNIYTCKKDGVTHDILDRAKRKDAYIALWNDEQPLLERSAKSAISGNQLPPIIQAAAMVPTARAVEYEATGNTDVTNGYANQLKDHSIKLIDSALNDLDNRTNQISDAANITDTLITDTGVIRQRRGLGRNDPTILAAVERACVQIISAVQGLAQVFPGDNSFRDRANRATAIGQKANKTRFTSY